MATTISLAVLTLCVLIVGAFAMNTNTTAALPNTGAEITLDDSKEEPPIKETVSTDENKTSDSIVSENNDADITPDAPKGDVVNAAVKNGQMFVEEYGYLKYVDADYEAVQYMRYVKNAHTIVEYQASVVYVSEDGREVQFNIEGLTLFNFMCVEDTGYKIGDIVTAYCLFSFDE